MADTAIARTELPLPCRRGKVRDCYDLGDELLIISTDRISAFDHILSPPIPGKGAILTAISKFWFDQLPGPHHLLRIGLPPSLQRLPDAARLASRAMIVRKAQVVPFECVVRGYLEGSAWKEYQLNGSICGIPLPAGLQQCDRLPEPIFTPATKADVGHDENVTFAQMADKLGNELAGQLRERSLEIYQQASVIASNRGLILADTKFEFGFADEQLLLIDEVLTPDSSRYWDAQSYQPGRPQPSFDKQFVREYLMSCGWDRLSPPPPLPPEIVAATLERYQTAQQRLCTS